MKTIVETDEKTEGLLALLDQEVLLMCMNYFYAGKLIGVGKTQAKIEDPRIVYETGDFSEDKWKDAQKLPHKYWYVRIAAIESYGAGKP